MQAAAQNDKSVVFASDFAGEVLSYRGYTNLAWVRFFHTNV